MAKVYAFIAAFFLSVKTAFDIRDFLFLGGFLLLGYGLYLYSPWISFTIAGVLLMVAGYFWKAK